MPQTLLATPLMSKVPGLCAINWYDLESKSWIFFLMVKVMKRQSFEIITWPYIFSLSLFSTLGATSVLSIVNIGFGGKSRPHVGYATALDTFIILCFIAVFAALIEFACINFIDTFVKRRKKKHEDLKIQLEQKEQQQSKLQKAAQLFTENICNSPVHSELKCRKKSILADQYTVCLKG